MTFPTRTLHSSARRSRAACGSAPQVAGGGGPWERQAARRRVALLGTALGGAPNALARQCFGMGARYDGYAGGPVSDPQGPASGASRVVRGGGWSSVAQGCRAAFRSFNAPAARDPLPGLPPHQVCCPWPLIACTLGAFCKPMVSQAAPGAR